jgi:hypothetical protein
VPNCLAGSTGLGGITKLPPASAPVRKDANAILAMREALFAQPPKTAVGVEGGTPFPVLDSLMIFSRDNVPVLPKQS